MAIAMAAIGAFVGIMAKLYIERPDLFLGILTFLSIAPLFLAFGTIFWLGLRRGMLHPKAFCRSCERELSARSIEEQAKCPDCGADLLQAAAVHFVTERQPRRWGLVAWGSTLLLIPLAIFAVRVILIPSNDLLQLFSSRRLIQNELPTRQHDLRIWAELTRRLTLEKLSRQEVNDAVKQLTADFTNNVPDGWGWDQPILYQGGFIQSAVQMKMIDDDVYFAFCDAFFGTKPILVVKQIPSPNGSISIELEVLYGSTWGEAAGIPAALLWEVKDVKVNGMQINEHSESKSEKEWSAVYDLSLPGGEYPVVMELECAYVDRANLMGVASPNTLPSSKWPTPLKRWAKTVSTTIQIESINSQ